jgi:hypothetical protein
MKRHAEASVPQGPFQGGRFLNRPIDNQVHVLGGAEGTARRDRRPANQGMGDPRLSSAVTTFRKASLSISLSNLSGQKQAKVRMIQSRLQALGRTELREIIVEPSRPSYLALHAPRKQKRDSRPSLIASPL